MQYVHLITLAEALAGHLNRSEATISNWCVGNAVLFKRLRSGNGCTLKTANRAVQHLSDIWPSDLTWPTDIPRPAPNRKEVA